MTSSPGAATAIWWYAQRCGTCSPKGNGRRSLTGRRVTAVPKAVIMEFTMHKEDGAWKVAENVGWRFLSIPTGRITDEP